MYGERHVCKASNTGKYLERAENLFRLSRLDTGCKSKGRTMGHTHNINEVFNKYAPIYYRLL